jgi:putative effector of murein hydrolase
MNGGGILAGGAGDSISGLMNAAVSALGIRMFDSRKVLEENWQPLVGGAGLSALFGLFSTAYAAG